MPNWTQAPSRLRDPEPGRIDADTEASAYASIDTTNSWRSTGRPARRIDNPSGHFVALPALGRFLDAVEAVTVRRVGDAVIFDIRLESEEPDQRTWYDEERDGAGRLAALMSPRSDLIDGDLRLFYLLRLTAVEAGDLDDTALAPLPGIGPLTGALEEAADFFRLDPDLVQAVAEGASARAAGLSPGALEAAIPELPDAEKDAFLLRLLSADPMRAAS